MTLARFRIASYSKFFPHAFATKLCAGIEEYKFEVNGEAKGVALTVQVCYPTTWGSGACPGGLVDSGDRSIRPFGMASENVCLFKKYAGYRLCCGKSGILLFF